jgi:hypothetical protein
MFLLAAAQDYAATRCLLLNCLVSGFAMGAQTCEKFLKAYLLLKKPELAVRRFRHSLTELSTRVDELSPALELWRFSALTERFQKYYNVRYPDSPEERPKIMNTVELFELDEFIMILNDNLDCPQVVKYRTGLYALVTFSLNPLCRPTPTEKWLKLNNKSLAKRWPQIESEYHEVMAALHPKLTNASP